MNPITPHKVHAFQGFWQLLRKDLLLEWRNRYGLFSLLLYVISSTYLLYLSMQSIKDPTQWVALIWVVSLFTAVTTAGRSFQGERAGRFLYLYTLVKPQSLILAKMLFNTLLMAVGSMAVLVLFSLLLGSPGGNALAFALVLCLGSMGFAAVLTTTSAMAAKANGNPALLAILSFPLLFPLLLTAIKASFLVFREFAWDMLAPYLGALALLNLLVILLGYLLFPYLWRD